METQSQYTVQGSDEWKAARLGHLGASRFADVLTEPRSKADKEAGKLSATAETCLLAILGEYLTGLPSDDFTSAATRWGTEWEPEARSVYESTMDCDVDQVGFIHHPTLPRVGCSPDGLVGADGLIEIKCPFGTKEHVRTALSQEVPDQYIAQTQGQLWVTGRKWSHFVSYDPRVKDTALRLIVVPVERDEEFIGKLEQAVTRFVRVLLESIQELGGRI